MNDVIAKGVLLPTSQTAIELRRLQAVNADLRAELKACEAHLHDYVEAVEYGGGSASKSAKRLASIRAAIAKAVQA